MTSRDKSDTNTVVFTPSGKSGSVPSGISILDAARLVGADLDSVCGGRGLCGRCQVEPIFGNQAKWGISATAEHITAPGSTETSFQAKRNLAPGRRLGCRASIEGDVVIDVPPASQVNKQVLVKGLDSTAVTIDPLVRLYYLELDPNDWADATRTVLTALDTQWGIDSVTVAPAVLPRLHNSVSAGQVSVAVRHHPATEPTLIGIWPGLVERCVGAAIDLGSTTVAAHLCDLASGEVLATAGRMNPQIRFGEDLMSRVSYAMMNDDGAARLTSAVHQALDELIDELVDDVDNLDRSHLVDVVVVGNPIMHHLVLGIDPTPLGQSPFTLATSAAVEGPASLVGINAPSATVYLAPCIAGHVGADTAAAILSEGPHRGDAQQLLVDIGTNAEIVVGNRHRLLAASSPTGPAFEGAEIEFGQRATAGAIERVRIDRTTLEPSYKVIGIEPWSNEPGFDDQAARTPITGICGSGIIEIVSELFLSGVINHDGTITTPPGKTSQRIVSDNRTMSYLLTDTIRLTQNDVRAIQLAKAALRAGIELLLECAELDHVDEIRLAGAFGSKIDPLHAMVLGLIPDAPLDQVSAVGNAAGAGARQALLSASNRREMQEAVATVTKVETATEPRFQEHFVAAMAFPHLNSPTPNLSAVVQLPARTDDTNSGQRRRRRTRSRPSKTQPAA